MVKPLAAVRVASGYYFIKLIPNSTPNFSPAVIRLGIEFGVEKNRNIFIIIKIESLNKKCKKD